MLLRYCHISLPILLSVFCTSPVKAADGEESALRRVRVIYLVSRDREEKTHSFAGNRPSGCFAQMSPDTSSQNRE